MARKIVWNKGPARYLKKALKRISVDSFLQAERVEEVILSSIEDLKEHPEKYPPDKFRRDNSGNYRAFEISSFRIAYKVTGDQIRILRIRHVRQEPKQY